MTAVDVTRFAQASITSGIPRLQKAFIESHILEGGDLIVETKYGFAKVEFDSASASITYPKSYWKRAPKKLPLATRYIKLTRLPILGAITIFVFSLPGVSSFSRRIVSAVRNYFDGKPRVVEELLAKTVLLLEVPSARTSMHYLDLLKSDKLGDLQMLVHDLLPLTHPQYFDTTSCIDHLHMARLFRFCSVLYVGTEQLEKQLRNLMESWGAEFRGETEVIELPSLVQKTEMQSEVGESHITKLLFIGAYQSRKGLSLLLDTIEQGIPHSWEFLVVGTPRPTDRGELNLYSRAKKLSNVIQHRNLSQGDLENLFNTVDAIIYPSEAEGFGMPIVEAVSCSRPVVVRDTALNRYFAAKYPGVFLFPHDEVNQANGLKSAIMSALDFKFPASYEMPNTAEVWAESLLRSSSQHSRRALGSPNS